MDAPIAKLTRDSSGDMGVGAGLYMYVHVVVVQKFTFAISSPDEFLFYLLPLTCYKAKRVKSHFLLEGVGQFEARFQGEEVVPWEYFLVSTILDTFCYLTVQTAPCYLQSF